jgi:hypothetical protein
MELDYAFFADSAASPDRKLYVLGGGFSTIQLPQIPGRVGFVVCAGFRFSEADAGRTYAVELRFVDEHEKLVVPPATLQFQFQSGFVPEGSDVEVTVPTISFLNPTFADPGRYAAEYWLGDRMLTQVRLRVVEQPLVPGAGGELPN